MFFNDLNWLERKVLLIVLSILLWVSEFPDVWQILNKRPLWFGLSGSDQSHHHQTPRERWWNQALRWGCSRAGTGVQGRVRSGSSENQINRKMPGCWRSPGVSPTLWSFHPIRFMFSWPWIQIRSDYSKLSYWTYERQKDLLSAFKRHFLKNRGRRWNPRPLYFRVGEF